MNQGASRTSLKTRIVVAICAPLLFLAIIELLFSLAGLGDPPPFFVEDPNDSTRLLRAADYREFYATPPVPILKQKPANGFRVAVIGESTVAGYPYFYATFCDRLSIALDDVLPERKCEVINGGLVGWTTFRLLFILDECLKQKPDVVIWMVGHNEERSADNVLRLRARAENPVRETFLGLIGKLHVVRWLISQQATRVRSFAPELTRSMPRIGPEANLIKEEFREGLREVVAKVAASGAKLILTTMPRNARTLAPTGSGNRADISESDLENFNYNIREASAAFDIKDYTRALSFIDAAIRIDKTPAAAHFFRGRILEQIGRGEDAHLAFVESMERDFWPSRAREWIQQMIREQASASGAALVDLLSIFDSRGSCNTAGPEFFCDDVHPNLEGHRLIAELLLQAIRELNIPIPGARWRLDLLRDEAAMRQKFGTAEMEAFAEHRANGYGILFNALMLPPGDSNAREATAAEGRLRLEKAHALLPSDARTEVLLATAEVLSGKAEAGAARWRAVAPRDRAATREFIRIVEASPYLKSLLKAGGIDVAATGQN